MAQPQKIPGMQHTTCMQLCGEKKGDYLLLQHCCEGQRTFAILASMSFVTFVLAPENKRKNKVEILICIYRDVLYYLQN